MQRRTAHTYICTYAGLLCAIVLFFMVATSAEAATIGRPMNNESLVGYWSFDFATDGRTVYDKSGNRNNGTLTSATGTANWTDGKMGGGIDLDGVNDFIVADSDVVTSLPVTLAVWLKAKSFEGNAEVILQTDNDASVWYCGVQILINTTGIVGQTGDCAGNALSNRRSYIGGTALSTNTWYHAVFVVRSDTDVSLYLNGVLQTTTNSGTAGSVAFTGDNTTMGLWTLNTLTDRYSDTVLDDARVYNRALSADEVQRLYNFAAPKFAKPELSDGLVGYWDFGFATDGKTVVDRSSNRIEGTLTSATGTANWVDGKIDGGMVFDGVNDFVSLGDIAVIDSSNTQLSISAWFKLNTLPTAAASRKGIVAKYSFQDAEREFALIVGDSATSDWDAVNWNVQEVNNAFNAASNMKSTSAITTSTWYHVVATYLGGTRMRIYLNGVLDAELTSNVPTDFTNTAEPVTIGAGEDDGQTLRFDGVIDEVRVYNRELSADEARRLYLMGL